VQPAGFSQAACRVKVASGGSYRGAQGLAPDIIAEIERRHVRGFTNRPHTTFLAEDQGYTTFTLATASSRRQLIDLILEKMPVSISLGL